MNISRRVAIKTAVATALIPVVGLADQPKNKDLFIKLGQSRIDVSKIQFSINSDFDRIYNETGKLVDFKQKSHEVSVTIISSKLPERMKIEKVAVPVGNRAYVGMPNLIRRSDKNTVTFYFCEPLVSIC